MAWETMTPEKKKSYIRIHKGKIYLPAEITKHIEKEIVIMQNGDRYGIANGTGHPYSLHVNKKGNQGTITSIKTTKLLNKNGFPDSKYEYKKIEEKDTTIYELKRQG